MLVFMFFLIAKTCIVCIINHTNTKQDISMDCHPVRVKAALKMGKANLLKLAKEHRYAHISAVLHRPWVAAQRIVTRALGVARRSGRGVPDGTKRRMFEECPMKVAAITGRASELSSATSEEECTVRKGFVKTEGHRRLAGGA
jgi:lambda repressor-like predicted transcriptional regulator